MGGVGGALENERDTIPMIVLMALITSSVTAEFVAVRRFPGSVCIETVSLVILSPLFALGLCSHAIA